MSVIFTTPGRHYGSFNCTEVSDIKVKMNMSLWTPWREMVVRGLTPLILNFDIWWRSVVSCTFQLLCPRDEKKPPVSNTLYVEPVWSFCAIRSTLLGIELPDLQAHCLITIPTELSWPLSSDISLQNLKRFLYMNCLFFVLKVWLVLNLFRAWNTYFLVPPKSRSSATFRNTRRVRKVKIQKS
jgi:hypothetical protein